MTIYDKPPRFLVAAAAVLATGVLWAQQAPAPAPAAPQGDRRRSSSASKWTTWKPTSYVTDAQGNPVNDLKADDFEVLEDGKPQKVTSFSLVNIPIERAERPLFATAPVEQDVQTNDHIEGRIYLIVLDDVHTEFTRTPRVKAAMRRFFERSFGTNDLAAIVFTGRSNGSQDFTNNPRLLMAAVTSSWAEAAVGDDQQDRRRPRQSGFGRPAGGRRQGHDGAQLQRAERHGHRAQARRVHGQRARPPQSTAARGRGRGLRHPRGSRAGGLHRVGGAARHPRRHRVRHARQRQHLRHRSARPEHGVRRPDHPELHLSRSRAPA
jgi:hypothetical protein